MERSKKGTQTRQGQIETTDSDERSIHPHSPAPVEQEPERINKMLKAAADLPQGSFGIVAQSREVTGQAKTTVCTEGGATGPAIGALVAESKVNDEQIDVISKVGTPQAPRIEASNANKGGAARAEEPKNGSQGDTAMQPTDYNKDKNCEPNSAIGLNAGSVKADILNNSVVQNSYHLLQASTSVKTFCTADIPTHTFVGREKELELVHEKLQKSSATEEHHVRRIVALVSTHRMGKTQIARAFVQKYKVQYENVAWVDATTDSTARTCFINLAKRLKVDHSDDDKGKDLAARVHANISDQCEKPTLLIFDNAQKLETDEKTLGIIDYLPTQVKRNLPFILVTSRSDEWKKHCCEVVEVTPLTEEDSLKFFRTVFRLPEKEEEDSELHDLLQQLAEKLDGHPVRLKRVEKLISSVLDQYTHPLLIESLRNCIEKVDDVEFSAEVLDNDVERLSVEILETQVAELSAQSGPRSVQIMEFEQVPGGTQTRKAILFETEFRQVIEKCHPSRPVVVLAIAGKANKGKSLFLSYVLRYLNALQQGKEDWMGWEDTTVLPVEGFRWANGYEVITRGMWIWSEPITCRNSKGEQFDVLLIDTQGVFDENTGQREWSILGGLSLLTSSLIIMNTNNDVQEDVLMAFQNFLSFGLLVLEHDDEGSGETEGKSKPFQNLVFLVRDWELHQQFPFGNQGGRNFINRKLEEKAQHDDCHRKIRQQMKACFEDINCLLLPYPGRSVREDSFTGSVVNAHPEFQDFAKQMQLCIEELVNPDKLPFKSLNGNILKASDLLGIFMTYIQTFNSAELPSSNDIFNAMAEQCNAVIIAKCVEAFEEQMDLRLSSLPFLDEMHFSEIQKGAQDESILMFKESRKMGDAQVAEGELMTKLAEKASLFQAQNKIKMGEARQDMEAHLEKIITSYDAEMDFKIGENVYDQDTVQVIQNELAADACKKWQDSNCHRLLEEEGLGRLQKHFLRKKPKIRSKLRRAGGRLNPICRKYLPLVLILLAMGIKSPGFSLFNTRETEKVMAQAFKEMVKAEDAFTNEIKGLLARCEDEKCFNVDASVCKSHAKSRLEASINVSVNDKKILQDIVSEWDTKADEILSRYKKLMKTKYQQTMENFKARNNLSKFEKEFRDEMEKLLNNRPDEQTFDVRASYMQNQLRTKLQSSMDATIMGAQSVQEIMSSWNNSVQEIQRQYKVTLRNQIQQRLESAKAQAYTDSAKVEQKFRTGMEKLLNNGTDERAFNREAYALKNRLRIELENSMDVASIGQRSVQDVMSLWDSKAQTVLSEYKALLEQIERERSRKAQAIEDERRRKAIEEERRRKAIEEERRAKAIEDERRRKAFEEKRRAQAIEDERRQAKAIEDERRQAKAIEDERRRAKAIEDERQAKAIENERRRAQAIEDKRRRAQAMEDVLRRAQATEDERRRAQAIEDERRRARVEPECSRGMEWAATSRRKKEKPSTFLTTVKKFSWIGGLAGMAVGSFISSSESESD